MKIIVAVLLATTLTLGEVPPPYNARGFRPSAPFLLPSQLPLRNNRPFLLGSQVNSNQRVPPQENYGTPDPNQPFLQPQTIYGPPKPTKQILLPPQVNSNQQRQPQTTYGAPELNQPFLQPSQSNQGNANQQVQQPQATYGAPKPTKQLFLPSQVNSNQQIQPQTTYGAPSKQYLPQNSNWNQNGRNIEPLEGQNLPKLTPAKFRALGPNQFGATDNFNFRQNNFGNTPQQLPRFNGNQPQNTYNDPNIRNIEPFDELNRGRGRGGIPNNGNIVPLKQNLPVWEAEDFRKGFDQPNFGFSTTEQPTRNFNENNFGFSTTERPTNGFQQPNFGFSTTQQPTNGFDQNNFGVSTTLQPTNVRRVPSNNIDFNQQGQPQVPRNFANGQLPPIDARRFNSQPGAQNAFDIEEANVRKLGENNFDRRRPVLPQVPRQQQNRNVNIVPSTEENNLGNNPFPTAVVPNNSGEKYLPPTTTFRAPTRRRTRRPQVTPRPTEPSVNEEEEEDVTEENKPNVAVSTAFAGRLYLLQPDGSLQMTPAQNAQLENTKKNENLQVPQNYLQNYQTLPNPLYNFGLPLYTLVK